VWKGKWKSKNMTVAIKKVMEFPEREVSLYGFTILSQILSCLASLGSWVKCAAKETNRKGSGDVDNSSSSV